MTWPVVLHQPLFVHWIDTICPFKSGRSVWEVRLYFSMSRALRFFHGFEPRLFILHVACIMLGGMAQSHAVGGGATVGPGKNRYFGWAYFDIAERLLLPYCCPRTLELPCYQLLFAWPF